MNKIMGLEYIETIGIKENICTTLMGNSIYLLNNGKKFKKFNEDYRDTSDVINKEFLKTLKKQAEFYGHPLISFPEIIICENKELHGIISDFEEGIPLEKIDPALDIDNLLFLIEFLEKGIEDISFEGWDLEDLHENNILINPDSINNPARIIDTDFYYFYTQKERLEIYRINMRRISSAILTSILPNLSPFAIYDKELKDMYNLTINGLVKPSKFFKTLLLKIKHNNKAPQDIQTLRKTL